MRPGRADLKLSPQTVGLSGHLPAGLVSPLSPAVWSPLRDRSAAQSVRGPVALRSHRAADWSHNPSQSLPYLATRWADPLCLSNPLAVAVVLRSLRDEDGRVVGLPPGEPVADPSTVTAPRSAASHGFPPTATHLKSPACPAAALPTR